MKKRVRIGVYHINSRFWPKLYSNWMIKEYGLESDSERVILICEFLNFWSVYSIWTVSEVQSLSLPPCKFKVIPITRIDFQYSVPSIRYYVEKHTVFVFIRIVIAIFLVKFPLQFASQVQRSKER